MSWSEIKHAVNSTLGTKDFKPLDAYIQGEIQKEVRTEMQKVMNNDNANRNILQGELAKSWKVYTTIVTIDSTTSKRISIPAGSITTMVAIVSKWSEGFLNLKLVVDGLVMPELEVSNSGIVCTMHLFANRGAYITHTYPYLSLPTSSVMSIKDIDASHRKAGYASIIHITYLRKA